MFENFCIDDKLKKKLNKVVELTTKHPGEFTQRELCEITGVSAFAMCKWVNILNLHVKRKNIILKYHVDYIKKHHKTKTQKEIAEDLGINYWDVQKVAKEENLDFTKGRPVKESQFFEHDPYYCTDYNRFKKHH